MQSLKCQTPDLDFTSQENSWRTERREAYSKYCFMKTEYELKDVLKQPVKEKNKMQELLQDFYQMKKNEVRRQTQKSKVE